MLLFLKQNKFVVYLILFSFFFFSLVLTSNDINSKVLLLLVLYSLLFFDKIKLKMALRDHYPLLIIFVLVTLSLLYTENIEVGLQKIQRVLIIPLFFLIFPFANLSKGLWQKISLFFVGVVLLAALTSHGLTMSYFIENGETKLRNLFNLNYSYLALGNTLDLHPTYYSYFLLSAIVVSIGQLAKSNKWHTKVLWSLLILYFSFFIIHLSSRIGLMALYIVLVIRIVHFIRLRKAWLQGLLVLFIVHLALGLIVWNVGVTKYRIQHIFGFEYYTGYKVNDGQHKLKLWGAAINANDNFIFGNGMGDIEQGLLSKYRAIDSEKAVKEHYNSHNQYIEYYVGLGIIGLITFTYLLGYYAFKFLKHNNFEGFLFIVITAILCVTESIWSRHHGIMFFVAFLGVLWGLNMTTKQVAET